MNIDIFIRTYEKDLEWLKHALRSIYMHVSGYRKIVITAPKSNDFSKYLTETVTYVEDLRDGYLGQQLTKMNAYLYTDADAVVFWDSDVIACEPVNVSEWFLGGRPIVYKTSYAHIEAPWKPITEKAVGFNVEWEYMRRMPIIYFTDTVEACSKFIEKQHNVSLIKYISSQPYREFSEFNAIGAYAEKFESNRYEFIDTDMVELPKNKVHQFWSWSGLDSNDLNQIKRYIG